MKSMKPSLHYSVCKASLLNVTSVFPWYWFVCGTNQVKTLRFSNLNNAETICHVPRNTCSLFI